MFDATTEADGGSIYDMNDHASAQNIPFKSGGLSAAIIKQVEKKLGVSTRKTGQPAELWLQYTNDESANVGEQTRNGIYIGAIPGSSCNDLTLSRGYNCLFIYWPDHGPHHAKSGERWRRLLLTKDAVAKILGRVE